MRSVFPPRGKTSHTRRSKNRKNPPAKVAHKPAITTDNKIRTIPNRESGLSMRSEQVAKPSSAEMEGTPEVHEKREAVN